MRSVSLLYLFRAAALFALGTSVALTLDYWAAEPAFCGGASGCAAIRDSGLGSWPIFGSNVPILPLLGVAFFTLAFQSSCARTRRAREWAGVLGSLAAPVGALLLLAQAALGAFCSLCVIVDSSALVLSVCSWLLRGGGFEKGRVFELEPKGLALGRWGFQALFVGAWLAPLLYPVVVRTNPTPAVITELYQPGHINVVEFFDFGCPHCRELGPRLEALLEPYGERVHFVRRHVPLPFHQGAREAARVALCAEEQGRGERVTDAFLVAPDLDPATLERLALEAGVDAPQLASCLASDRPDKRLVEDRARIEEAGFQGLPTTFIGGLRFVGSMPNETYSDALERVARGADLRGLTPGTYWIVVAAALGLVLGLGTRGSRPAD